MRTEDVPAESERTSSLRRTITPADSDAGQKQNAAMTQTEDSSTQRPPARLRLIAAVGGGVLALGGLIGGGGGAMAAIDGDWTRPDAFVVFFGVCSLVAAALGVLVALGRFRATVGMTMLIASGILLVGGTLSEAQLVARVLGQPGGELRVYLGVTLRTLMLAQLACAGLGFVLTSLHVWMRRPSASLPLVVRSAIALGLLGALGAFVAVPGLRAVVTGLPQFLVALIVIVAGVASIVLASAGGHTLIRSYEVAREDGQSPRVSA